MKIAEKMLPHSGEMVLVDEIFCAKENFVRSGFFVRNGAAFVSEQGLNSFCLVEIMAQSLGVLRALCDKEQANKLGFLLSVRNYEIKKPFAPLDCLVICESKAQSGDENGFGVWECAAFALDSIELEKMKFDSILSSEIKADLIESKSSIWQKNCLASGLLNVYNPNEEFLENLQINL